MTLWKLSCRWGSKTPLFYDFIKANEIVITWIDKPFKKNDWILIADGHTVLAFAKVLENPTSSLSFPNYKSEFEELQIPFDNNLLVAKANWIILNDSDHFKYQLQQGICKVQDSTTKGIFKSNLKRYVMKFHQDSLIKLLKHKKQIILQGPPGTGKTYTAKDIAEQMIFDDISQDKKAQKKRLESSEQFSLVQFHPSYTYEDFVRGITAKSNGTSIEYITENKPLALFAENALNNQIISEKTPADVSKVKWLDEQFDEFIDHMSDLFEDNEKFPLTDLVSIIKFDKDAFRYKGTTGWSENGNRMLFSDIKKAFLDGNEVRQDIKKNKNLSGLANHHSSYYIRVLDVFKNYLNDNTIVFKPKNVQKEPLKNYILIIDEINRANLPSVLGELIYALEYRGDTVGSIYEMDDKPLIIPPNLYIIGTMNTADRSVGHIDYAIRRRFAFVDVLPDASVIQNESAKRLFEEVSALFQNNDTLAPDFKAKQVQLGHSYFLVKDDNELNLRAKYEIFPILEEYVNDGILLEKAEKTIQEIKQRFGI